MSANIKNYFAGESPDIAPNHFTTPQPDLTSELCELCMRFGALHEAINIVESLKERNADVNILSDLQLHCITLYWSCEDLMDKHRQHGANAAQVEEFRKTLRAERGRMQS